MAALTNSHNSRNNFGCEIWCLWWDLCQHGKSSRRSECSSKLVLHMLERLLESTQPTYASVGKLSNEKEDIVLALPNIPPTHLKCSFANWQYANLRMIMVQTWSCYSWMGGERGGEKKKKKKVDFKPEKVLTVRHWLKGIWEVILSVVSGVIE